MSPSYSPPFCEIHGTEMYYDNVRDEIRCPADRLCNGLSLPEILIMLEHTISYVTLPTQTLAGSL